MRKIKFSMNVYYSPNTIIKEIANVQRDVLNRMEENDCQDLYNGIEQIEDEDIFSTIESFIEKSTIEELAPFVLADKDSIRFDKYETSECDYNWFAYLVDVIFDIEKVLIQIK